MLKTFLTACTFLDRRSYWSMGGVMLLILVNMAFEMIGIGLVPPFLSLVANPAGILAIEPLRQLYVVGGFSNPTSFLALCGLGFVVLIAVKNILFLCLTNMSARFVSNQAAAISHRLLSEYLNAPYSAHLRWSGADIVTTTDATVDQVSNRVIYSGINAAAEMLVLFGISVVLVAVEPVVTLMVAGVLGGLFFILFVIIQSRMASLGARDIELRRDRLKCVQNALGSIKELKILGREGFFLSLFQKLRATHAELLSWTTTLQQVPRTVIETIVMAGIMTIVLFLMWQGRDAASVVGVLGLFGVAAFRLIPSLSRLMMALNNLRYGRPATERVAADFMRAAGLAETDKSDLPFAPLRESIAFENVSFSYVDSAAPTLRDVSFLVGQGESLGIIGPSGAGKSTLVDLMLGLLTPNEGRILVDGRDIASNRRGWQQYLGYVPQSINLIDDTVRRNIALGLPDDEIDDAAVWRALAFAQLDKFIAGLPQGLDMPIGDRGVLLSGGQRQRLGIARALYNDPPVVVMDEATSALDGETEDEITRALDALHGKKTLIVIAHRLTTLRSCDKLIVLNNGQVQDIGSFAELNTNSAEFRKTLQYSGIQNPKESAAT